MMIKKSMIMAIMLLQGCVVLGSENSLRKSASDLRKSSDKVSSRSCSQEFPKKMATVLAADALYDYPGGGLVYRGIPHFIKPYPYLPGEFPGQ